MNILLVEDDVKITKFLSKGLEEEGYAVTVAHDGEAGLEAGQRDDFDALILDLMLPKMNGLEICRALRRDGRKYPIIILTARETVKDRVEGLDAGADDYVVKPFAFSELLARLRAVMRRKEDGGGQVLLETAGLKVDLVAHKASFAGKTIDLTSREFALLEMFMRRKGQVLTRTNIIESVWGYDFQTGTNVIDVYINYLRKKLRQITGKEWIQTVRKMGYIFEEPAG